MGYPVLLSPRGFCGYCWPLGRVMCRVDADFTTLDRIIDGLVEASRMPDR